MTCRWDRDREEYLADGEPCRVDDYGDPTRHCTLRRSCSNHVGAAELTCARCIGKTRGDIRAILDRSAELWSVLLAGTERHRPVTMHSEAAYLVGPAADVEAWSWLKVAAKQGRIWHASMLEDDDDFHPYTVLTRWEFMLREDYDQPRDSPTSVASAAAYLERTLPRLANDDSQDFQLFAREIRACRAHLEAVLQDGTAPEHGAPCPMCAQPAPKLNLEHGHWCTDPDCQRQFHYSTAIDDATGEDIPDTSGDRWVCPHDREHWWTEEDYRRWVADVYEANKVGA